MFKKGFGADEQFAVGSWFLFFSMNRVVFSNRDLNGTRGLF